MKLFHSQNMLLIGTLRKYTDEAIFKILQSISFNAILRNYKCRKEVKLLELVFDQSKNGTFSLKNDVNTLLNNTFVFNQLKSFNKIGIFRFQGNHKVSSNFANRMTSKIKQDRNKQKLIRVTTVSGSLWSLLTGQLKFMNQYYEVVGVSNFGEGLERVHENEGVRTQGIKMTRSITPLIDLIATYRLYRFFKKEKPFIVHTHTPKAGTLGMLAARMAGVPHRLHTVAGLPLLEETGIKRVILDNVEKITYSCATKVLPNSFGLKDIILENNYTNSEKLKVIGQGSSNGINTSFYNSINVDSNEKTTLKKKLGITEDDLVFIFVGRIVKDKGINELVEAFHSLSKSYYNCKLLIVGPRENSLDPILPATESLINQNKQIIDVDFQDDIRPYVAISHVLAFPSYREGFPNVVLQASSMGLPCIVTNINGCNEIIEHELNGLIINPKSEEELLKAMKFMIDNPEKRTAMITFTRSRIIEKFQQDFVWKELLKFYKTLN